MPIARDRQELLEMLDEQKYFLGRSARDYDDGNFVEAKLMAVHLRVLFHDTRSSYALLTQLGLRDTLTWVDTGGPVVERGDDFGSSLTSLKVEMSGTGSSEASYVPYLSSPLPIYIETPFGPVPVGSRFSFSRWWNTDIIKDANDRRFSRRALVLALSNQEGGAHVDPAVKTAYRALAKTGWTIGDSLDSRPIDSNPVFPTLRQVVYEVLESLDQQESKLI